MRSGFKVEGSGFIGLRVTPCALNDGTHESELLFLSHLAAAIRSAACTFLNVLLS